ncbi:hypothetical protein VC60_gp48 [Mycobacterium phage Sbash]|uniref:Uncharacterized protein n=1 Tax=Mycobacterium phage Sbash TaxID=1567475 RepID=A0A0A7RVQ1_9CAUD|nr:hypothetical protein VC60_gp48 [Mycobacterium phage Sbash]AJA43349.1 hypothetical protein PBI_SBASH_48 [Mycobacterium phage Sbash]
MPTGDETYAHRVLQRVEGLAATYSAQADDETRAAIANLLQCYAGLGEALAAQFREMAHHAREAHEAREQRDELIVRVQELETELDELRQGVADGIAAACGGGS